MATKFRFIYNGVSSDFDDYYVRTDLFNQEQIWSFGSNNLGQLGDNTTVNKSSPVQEITFGVNWKQFSVNSFSSGIKTDGTLWTWGINTYGQLGDNTITHRSSAVQTVAFGSNWYSIANGYHHTIAVKNDGTLWTWGRNSYGQLGSNAITHRSSPTQTVSLAQNWNYVAGGYQHSLVSKSDGTLWSFGRNNFGQLGTGLLLHRSSPTQTLGFATNWSSVGVANTSGSTGNISAVKTDGTLWSCGIGTSGQLGDGTTTSKSSPVQTVSYTTNWSTTVENFILYSGSRHSASLKTDGTLWTWGRNAYGQLGDNTITDRSSPVQTIAFGTSWSYVSAGNYHAAAIKTDGTLWTWGRNTQGQLGDNTITHRSSPVQTISFGTNWSKVACGYNNTAAIKADGTLWMWGINLNGRLGDNTVTHRSSPVQTVAFGTNWSKVACGYHHTAAIKSDGTLWMWGRNSYYGPLGDNTSIHRSSPVQTVAFGTSWSYVAGGNQFTTAIKTDGTLWTWGFNAIGQLGDGTSTNRSSPVQTLNLGTTWSYVGSGDAFTLAVKNDGTLWAFGANTFGQLGNNTTGSRSFPAQAATYSFATNWSSVKLGAAHVVAIKSDGTLWSWGSNTNGQLSNNTTFQFSAPVQEITYSTTWSSISAGGNYTASIKTDGRLWLWGSGTNGQLGDNTSTSKSSPIQTLAGGTNWSSVSCGFTHIGATKTDGTLWAWGFNLYGQLGDNTITSKSSPIQTITFATNWSKVSAGYFHTGAIKTDGTAWTWGLGTSGQLGDGTIVNKSSPVQVVAYATNWSKVLVNGYSFSAAIKTDGTLWMWGQNSSGQLGDNTIIRKSSPVQTVAGGTNWVSFSCGTNHTAAIKTDGTLWMWGNNGYGILGDNSSIAKSSPVQTVAFGTNWSSVACGNANTIAIKTDGTLWTWGRNAFGQLGDNTTIHRSSPVQVIGFATTWSSVACGLASNHAIKKDGTLWVWGWNGNAQLGDNTTIHRSSPVQTAAFGTNWSSVDGGNNFTAAIKTDGTLWLWGTNDSGQLGDNTVTSKSSPIQTVTFATTWSSLSIGNGRSVAAKKTDGTLWMWGTNGNGELGDGTATHKSSPVQTAAFSTNWSSFARGRNHTAAIKTDGTLWIWGSNSYGALGINNTATALLYPVQPVGFLFATNWSNIACGTNNTVATKTDGTLWTWGINTNGSLGNSTTASFNAPTQTIAYGTNWSQTNFSNFGNMVGAIRTDGTLWTFGTNTNGQLIVDLPAANLSSPVQILPGTTWLQFSAGKFHSAFVKSDNTLWSSGDNTYGQLATNTSGAGPYVYPLQEISASTSWKQTACGDNHTMTVKTDGTLWGWGYNAYGQIGDNSATTKSSPVQTFGSANTWKQVACGSNHTIAIKIDGTVWTWGRGTQGQLGTSTATHRSSPIQTIAYGSNWFKVAAGYNNTTALFNYNVTL